MAAWCISLKFILFIFPFTSHSLCKLASWDGVQTWDTHSKCFTRTGWESGLHFVTFWSTAYIFILLMLKAPTYEPSYTVDLLMHFMKGLILLQLDVKLFCLLPLHLVHNLCKKIFKMLLPFSEVSKALIYLLHSQWILLGWRWWKPYFLVNQQVTDWTLWPMSFLEVCCSTQQHYEVTNLWLHWRLCVHSGVPKVWIVLYSLDHFFAPWLLTCNHWACRCRHINRVSWWIFKPHSLQAG